MLQQTPNLSVPKPQGFKPAGKVKIASRVDMARRVPGGGTINRFKEGLRYERAAVNYLAAIFDAWGSFISEPCFRFSNGHRTRFCFPDALVILPERSFDLLIEIKTRHTYDAWWQLKHLYYPVVYKALKKPLRMLEVTKSYDPAIRLPEDETRILDKAEDVLESDVPYNIFIWTGRK